MMWMYDGHFCAHGKLTGSKDLQKYWGDVKDETPLSHAK